jgi:hypothetical protein
VSTRVRMVAYHPQVGLIHGSTVKKRLMEMYYSGSLMSFPPIEYSRWPTWKKLQWVAKLLGNWKLEIFREPRRCDRYRSKMAVAYYKKTGAPFPNKKGKKGKVAKKYENGYFFARQEQANQPPLGGLGRQAIHEAVFNEQLPWEE